MKARSDCLVCMIQQALNTIRFVTDDPALHHRVLVGVAEEITRISPLDERPPVVLCKPVYDLVSEITGIRDPYKKAKDETNRQALELLPEVRKVLDASADRLKTGLLLAAAGNVIDFGIGQDYDLVKDVLGVFEQGFGLDHSEEFKAELRPGRSLLYLGDNAGEIVFDRLLVELLKDLGLEVTFTVKSGPILNDATMDDARVAGITDLVKVIETGGADIGLNWDRVSAEFRQAFETADIIVSKGQGNFEASDHRPENIYFLLKAKCQVIADELDVRLGQVVFKKNRWKPLSDAPPENS